MSFEKQTMSGQAFSHERNLAMQELEVDKETAPNNPTEPAAPGSAAHRQR
jgi:hypothetical protein